MSKHQSAVDSPKWLKPQLLILMGMIFLLLWRIPYYGKNVLDDPQITFRYGYNLVHHGQLAFNVGEPVLASTTPVFIFITALFEWLRLPVPVAVLILNLALEVVLMWVMWRIISHLPLASWGRGVVFAAYVLLTVTNRAFSIASNSGMETVLFTLLNYTALLLVVERRMMWAVVVASLATLTRPDGVFVLLIVFASIVLLERRLPWREILVSAAIGLPWAAYAQLTFGSFIPHSVIAKDAIAHIWKSDVLFKLRVAFYEPFRLFVVVIVPLALLGLAIMARQWRQLMVSLILLFVGIQFVYLFVPSNLGFEWYFAPLHIGLNLMVGVGLVALLSRWRLIGLASSVLLMLGVAYTSIGNYLSVIQMDRQWRSGAFALIDYMEANGLNEVSLQTVSIGFVGYRTPLRIIDPHGLASREAIPIIEQAPDLQTLNVMVAAELQPDYIMSYGEESRYDGYEILTRFPIDDYVDLVLYERDETVNTLNTEE